LREQGYPAVSLNFHDLYEYKFSLNKFKEHIQIHSHQRLGSDDESSLLKRFFRFDKNKLLWMTPFAYSGDKERTGGFNDEDHLLLNLNTKVPMTEYYEMAVTMGPDFVVAPTEQITSHSGKKKRKRALKASAKSSKTLAKIIRQQQHQPVLLTPVTLGDEGGLDTFDMRTFVKDVFGENEDGSPRIADEVQGFMIYGTDLLKVEQAFTDVKDFFSLT
jgi:hypothetical protein